MVSLKEQKFLRENLSPFLVRFFPGYFENPSGENNPKNQILQENAIFKNVP